MGANIREHNKKVYFVIVHSSSGAYIAKNELSTVFLAAWAEKHTLKSALVSTYAKDESLYLVWLVGSGIVQIL